MYVYLCAYWKRRSSLHKHVSSNAVTEQDAVPSKGFAYICDLRVQWQNSKITENEKERVWHTQGDRALVKVVQRSWPPANHSPLLSSLSFSVVVSPWESEQVCERWVSGLLAAPVSCEEGFPAQQHLVPVAQHLIGMHINFQKWCKLYETLGHKL